jgi:hypothetical protein
LNLQDDKNLIPHTQKEDGESPIIYIYYRKGENSGFSTLTENNNAIDDYVCPPYPYADLIVLVVNTYIDVIVQN